MTPDSYSKDDIHRRKSGPTVAFENPIYKDKSTPSIPEENHASSGLYAFSGAPVAADLGNAPEFAQRTNKQNPMFQESNEAVPEPYSGNVAVDATAADAGYMYLES